MTVPVLASAATDLATVEQVLAWCEQGRAALVEAESVAQAHDLLGVASTLEHAVKARDLGRDAAIAASALHVRAMRRVGQLLAAQPKAPAGRPSKNRSLRSTDSLPATLADQGITRDESSAYQRLAAVPDTDFEEAVEAEETRAKTQKGPNVTRAGVMRRANPEAEMRADEWWLAADKFTAACQRVTAHAEVAIKAARFGHYPADRDPNIVRAGIERMLLDAAEAIRSVHHEIERRR